MKKLARFIFLSIPLLLSACGFYNPNLRNSPMLTKAGEIQGSGHYHVGRGFEAQGAVAITNHIGVIGNFAYRKEGQPENGEKRTFTEGGIGYFGKQGRIGFEIFGGYGEGNVSFLHETDMSSGMSYMQTGKLQRFFIQPALLDRGRVFSAAFVPRLSYVQAADYMITGDYDNHSPFRQGWYFEPAGVGRVMLHKNIFFSFQGGLSIRLNKGQQYPFFQTSAGIGFRFNAQE